MKRQPDTIIADVDGQKSHPMPAAELARSVGAWSINAGTRADAANFVEFLCNLHPMVQARVLRWMEFVCQEIASQYAGNKYLTTSKHAEKFFYMTGGLLRRDTKAFSERETESA